MYNDVIWWLVTAFVGACAITGIAILYRGLGFLLVTTMTGRNSDKAAVENFLALLEEAKESMVVYDDGNKMEGSIYQNDRVIEAVH